jgi:predicted transcriptional regulator of viral defense system
MNYLKLRKTNKYYFGYEEISRCLGITQPSTMVTASRYVKQGFLVRIMRNLYILRERWEVMGREEKFTLANLVQVPF